jgi:hypothetical protein
LVPSKILVCSSSFIGKIVMKKTLLLASLLAAFALTACGKKEEMPVAPVEPAAAVVAPAEPAAAPADAAAAAPAAVGADAATAAADAAKAEADKAAAGTAKQ